MLSRSRLRRCELCKVAQRRRFTGAYVITKQWKRRPKCGFTYFFAVQFQSVVTELVSMENGKGTALERHLILHDVGQEVRLVSGWGKVGVRPTCQLFRFVIEVLLLRSNFGPISQWTTSGHVVIRLQKCLLFFSGFTEAAAAHRLTLRHVLPTRYKIMEICWRRARRRIPPLLSFLESRSTLSFAGAISRSIFAGRGGSSPRSWL